MNPTPPAPDVAASPDRASTRPPRLVVWVELPAPREAEVTRSPEPVFDPSSLYEDYERWDGMA